MTSPDDPNRRWRRFHALSGAVIGLFLLAHLANHLAMFRGSAAHIAAMDALRPIYRFAPVELILSIALAFQLGSGFVMARRRWRQRPSSPIAWTQITFGLLLALFLLNHVAAVWTGRLVMNLDTNYYFAAAGFHAGYSAFFIPYYFVGVAALFVHLACGAYWHVRVCRRAVFAAITSLGIGLAAAFVAHMANDSAIPLQYLTVYP